jgi:hypothetical protein
MVGRPEAKEKSRRDTMTATRYHPTIHHNQRDADRSIARIRQLVEIGYTYEAIAEILNDENYRTLRGKPWTALNVRQVIFKLRANSASWYALSARRANFSPAAVH